MFLGVEFMRNHFVPSTLLLMWLGLKVIFQGAERPWELFFSIVGITNVAFDEIAEVMIQLGEWP
jgi:hypothetical protein